MLARASRVIVVREGSKVGQIDEKSAHRPDEQSGDRVRAVAGDGTSMAFSRRQLLGRRVLHDVLHVPSPELQNQLCA